MRLRPSNSMSRTASPAVAFAFLCLTLHSVSPRANAQGVNEAIISQHVRIRIATERAWIGLDVVGELERSWVYVNGATGGKMPRRVLVDIRWDESDSRAEPATSVIVIGMNHPAAAANMRGFLLHSAAREMGRMGLLSIPKEGVAREESAFLIEGMSEILAREFARTTRSLSGAWIMAQFLDRMGLLGLKVQTSWPAFSGGRHDLRAAAPGITFLLTCRELYGRDKLLKLFASLPKAGLEENIASIFKTDAATLEGEWLKRVRAYRATEDFTATTDEEAPRLESATCVPEVNRPGTTVQLRLFITRGANALLPEGIYIQDETSGKVVQASNPADKEAKYALVELPIEPGRQPGRYSYKVVALDEGGNVRSWSGTYSVER